MDLSFSDDEKVGYVHAANHDVLALFNELTNIPRSGLFWGRSSKLAIWMWRLW